MPDLFDPIELGDFSAKNRIFMSPLTRARAGRDAVPTPIMAKYYEQRAGAGLIISEATGISREGLGWPYAPGIWSDEQVEAWKPITKAVHDKGGRIACQLWHMGRMVHSSVTGLQPVAPSATTAPRYAHTYDGKVPYETARALQLEDISRIVSDYETAARNAIRAGFDGIQLHAANGYLIDEFLRDGTNHRTDEYGGSPENRIRFLSQVVSRIVATIGAEKPVFAFLPMEIHRDVWTQRLKLFSSRLLRSLSVWGWRGLSFAKLVRKEPSEVRTSPNCPRKFGRCFADRWF